MSAPLRVRFAPGDLLRARDLDADVGGEALHRARHVRAAHRTWGVAIGLGVTRCADGSAVIVGPGLGYDRRGREIVVGRPVVVPAVDRPEGSVVDLVAEAGRCGASLRWQDVAEPLGEGIVLARAEAGRGVLGALDASVAIAARPLAGGHVGSGALDVELAVGVFARATVDTSSGGFTATPTYVVTLGPAEDDGDAPLGNARDVAGPFLDVHDESPTGFALDVRFGVRIPAGGGAGLDLAAVAAARLGAAGAVTVRVTWVGVQSPERCDVDEPTRT